MTLEKTQLISSRDKEVWQALVHTAQVSGDAIGGRLGEHIAADRYHAAAEGSRLSLAYRVELIDYRRNGEVLIY